MIKRGSELVADILGISDATTIIREFDSPGDLGRAARQTIFSHDDSARQKFATLKIAHMIEQVITRQDAANGRLGKLEAEHDAVMSGAATGCRHLELLKTAFWKGVAITFVFPIALALILRLLGFLYFRGGK